VCGQSAADFAIVEGLRKWQATLKHFVAEFEIRLPGTNAH